jgi:hypothetical protein
MPGIILTGMRSRLVPEEQQRYRSQCCYLFAIANLYILLDGISYLKEKYVSILAKKDFSSIIINSTTNNGLYPHLSLPCLFIFSNFMLNYEILILPTKNLGKLLVYESQQ